ncbi:hypothetical protein [Paractinoplanes ferrugineus]|nr:hypothetical protein [Actinoplanes ferrugineus]
MASVLETDFYSHRFHFCFAEAGYDLAAVTAGHVIRDGIVPMVTVERLGYRSHRYVPSDDQPADALHARCRVCCGTHGENESTHPVVGSERVQSGGSFGWSGWSGAGGFGSDPWGVADRS